MSPEWSDWYTREDVTGWVLPRILRERAEAHPDRPYIRFGTGDWVTYGEIDARAGELAVVDQRVDAVGGHDDEIGSLAAAEPAHHLARVALEPFGDVPRYRGRGQSPE